MSGGPVEGSAGISLRILGFPVLIHPSAFVILGLIVLMQIQAGASAVIWSLMYGLVILGSVLVHELGHAVAGRALKMGPLSITLHAFGGYTQAARSRGPRSLLWMTAAGPFAGLLLGAAAAALFWTFKDTPSPTLYWALQKTAEVNLFWSLFNLLPMLPMDGGLILLHGLTLRIGERRAEAVVRVFSGLTAGGLLLYALAERWYFMGFFALYALSRSLKPQGAR